MSPTGAAHSTPNLPGRNSTGIQIKCRDLTHPAENFVRLWGGTGYSSYVIVVGTAVKAKKWWFIIINMNQDSLDRRIRKK